MTGDDRRDMIEDIVQPNEQNPCSSGKELSLPKRPEIEGYRAPAVLKAFRLLDRVAGSRKELGTSELAKELGFSKSTTHGLLRALVTAGALEENPSLKTYRLGPAILELSHRSWNYLQVGRRAQSILEELRNGIGETVFLGVLSRSRGIIIACAEASRPLNISSPPGTTIPLLAGAVGKAYLSGLQPKKALELIEEQGLPRFTERSIRSTADYMDELSRVRQQGYALDDEEYLPGVKAIAVGLGNLCGLQLALWVVGFSGTMSEEKLPAIVQRAFSASEKLKRMLQDD